MKATIMRSDLLRALSRVRGAVGQNATIPILNNVLIRDNGNAVDFYGTNLAMQITVTAAAKVHAPGATTVPAVRFYDIVRQLPEGAQVALETDANALKIRAGRARFQLQTLPEGDFTIFSFDELQHVIDMRCDTIRRVFEQVLPAVAIDDRRMFLTGISLHTREQNWRAVATDGHRLAQCAVRLSDQCAVRPPDEPPGPWGRSVIVPRATAMEALNLMRDWDGSVIVSMSRTLIKFTIGDTVLVSKLIDGKFPDYERVIPLGNDKIVEIDRLAFERMIARVAAVMGEQGHVIRVDLQNGVMTLSAHHDGDMAEEDMDVDWWDEEPFQIGLNSLYLYDIVSRLRGEIVTMRMAGAESPVVIAEKFNEDDFYVLMPMRLRA
jgi:DNA polymerase III subunit beta